MRGEFSSPLIVAAAVIAGSSFMMADSAQAGKVHWKQDPLAPSCYALAFDDTNQWFATPAGYAFKKGICLGERIKYKVELAPDGENFTASGANFCRYHVGEGHRIEADCSPRGVPAAPQPHPASD